VRSPLTLPLLRSGPLPLPQGERGFTYPSIFEKSATWVTASRNRASKPKRNARLSWSGSLTITASKKASIGARNVANAAIAPSKSSTDNAAAALGSAASSAVRRALHPSAAPSGPPPHRESMGRKIQPASIYSPHAYTPPTGSRPRRS